MTTCLSVNLNKIALVRNSRGRDYPSVAHFGRIALANGARGLTIHPRPDQRHARYSDIDSLKAVVAEFPDAELNVEGYPDATFLDHVVAARPDQCTLVPDAPGQLTSDHGWALSDNRSLLAEVVGRLSDAGIRTSLFVDHDAQDYCVAHEIGVDRVELYTEAYAHAYPTSARSGVLKAFEQAAARARACGLGVNAGHDLNQLNLGDFLSIEGILEVSIGHALTVEALEQGFAAAVGAYAAIIERAAR